MSVYFIGARELDLVKIGYAYNPVRRWRHLQTFSPVELTLEGAIPGGYEEEREFHKKFALARTRGEWFKLTPSLQADIDASSRPEKFTWPSVRAWLKMLADADDDDDRERKAVSPAAIALIEERLRSHLSQSARRRSMSTLQRREADGDIHFPFRSETCA